MRLSSVSVTPPDAPHDSDGESQDPHPPARKNRVVTSLQHITALHNAITSHHCTSHHITSLHFTSQYITIQHITSHHTSYHIISYHIISHCLLTLRAAVAVTSAHAERRVSCVLPLATRDAAALRDASVLIVARINIASEIGSSLDYPSLSLLFSFLFSSLLVFV